MDIKIQIKNLIIVINIFKYYQQYIYKNYLNKAELDASTLLNNLFTDASYEIQENVLNRLLDFKSKFLYPMPNLIKKLYLSRSKLITDNNLNTVLVGKFWLNQLTQTSLENNPLNSALIIIT